jgi:hypothetical protein
LVKIFQEEKCKRNKNNIFKEIKKAFSPKIDNISGLLKRKYGISKEDSKQTLSISLFKALNEYKAINDASFYNCWFFFKKAYLIKVIIILIIF